MRRRQLLRHGIEGHSVERMGLSPAGKKAMLTVIRNIISIIANSLSRMYTRDPKKAAIHELL